MVVSSIVQTGTSKASGTARRMSNGFSYTVIDARGATSTASVIITINGVKRSTGGRRRHLRHQGGQSLIVSSPGVLANDSDVDHDF